MDYSLLLCIEKREPHSTTCASPAIEKDVVFECNGTTEDSVGLLSPNTRHKMTFNGKKDSKYIKTINSFNNASRH